MLFGTLPSLFRKFLPSQCAVCRTWPSSPICTACRARFVPAHPRCLNCALELPHRVQGAAPPNARCPACQHTPFGLDACFAGLPYAFPWSDVVSRFKFNSQTGWAPVMAALMLDAPGVRDALAQLTPDDWLLPVPLSTDRLAWRGFNQAWELATALQHQSACRAKADARLLLRIRHTPPQSELKRSERLLNLQGAFAVEPLRASQLKGRRVMLVDDVMTSGASLLTAAHTLREAGATTVSAVVLARTAPT